MSSSVSNRGTISPDSIAEMCGCGSTTVDPSSRWLHPRFMRASFTWPGPGEVPKADKLAFACLNLDVMEDRAPGVFGSSPASVGGLVRSNSLAGRKDAAENPAKLMVRRGDSL